MFSSVGCFCRSGLSGDQRTTSLLLENCHLTLLVSCLTTLFMGGGLECSCGVGGTGLFMALVWKGGGN